MPGSQLAGLKFFHVIAKLIFSVFHRRVEIPANRTSPVNRASPPHVIGPLVVHLELRTFSSAVCSRFQACCHKLPRRVIGKKKVNMEESPFIVYPQITIHFCVPSKIKKKTVEVNLILLLRTCKQRRSVNLAENNLNIGQFWSSD